MTPHNLTSLSEILRLPVYPPSPTIPRHIVFRGSMMTFHYLLEELRVAHEVTVDPEDGMAIGMKGLVVERGGMGGVVVSEADVIRARDEGRED